MLTVTSKAWQMLLVSGLLNPLPLRLRWAVPVYCVAHGLAAGDGGEFLRRAPMPELYERVTKGKQVRYVPLVEVGVKMWASALTTMQHELGGNHGEN